MRSSQWFGTTGRPWLLTLALVSCGGRMVPQAQSGLPVQMAAGPATAQASGMISTLKVRPGTTEADLLSRYPGSRVLALHADEGYALLYSVDALSERRTTGPLSLNAQTLSVTTSEPDVVLSASEVDVQGTSAWAGGTSAWAGGYNSGSTATNPFSTFTDNLLVWNLLDVSGGQRMAPALGKGVRVAVIDTGVDLAHPGLAGHLDVASGWDYVGGDATPQEENSASSGYSPAYGHGTAVAGIISQVAPNATIVPYRVLNPSGKGKLSDVVLAINAAVKSGAKVINMSLGTLTASAALSSAVSSAIRSGAMVVASSGNSGDKRVTYPARYSATMQATLGGGLMSVGSEDLSQKKSKFSTYGSLDLLAPGEGVKTTFPGNRFTRATGTSFSAPLVSGEVALAMSNGRTDPVALYRAIKLNALVSPDLLYPGQLGSGTPNFSRLLTSR